MSGRPTDDELAQAERELRERVTRIEEASASSLTLNDALALFSNRRLEPAVRRAVLVRPDLPVEAFQAALADPDETVRAFAVGLQSAPIELVVAAEHDPAWQVRAELARRMDCPVEILARLSSDPDAIARRSAIAHAGVGGAVLLRVLTSGASRLDAELAAGHPTLDVLANEKELAGANAFGAIALLRRSDLPGTLVARFATADYPVLVRVAAVKHEGCPAKVIGGAACDDPSREVRQAAAGRKNCPKKALLIAAGDTDTEVRRAVAVNSTAPPAAVRLLLVDDDDLVRRDAAKSSHADPTILADLVWGDPDEKVRKAALGNKNCPAPVVDAACADEKLVFTAALNAACSPEGAFAALITIRVMPRQAGKGEVDAEQRQRDRVRSIAKRSVKEVSKQQWSWLEGHQLDRLNAEDLKDVIAKHLFDAASDSREAVRMAVASHPKADVTVLMALSNDASEAVRKAVSVRILNAVDGSI